MNLVISIIIPTYNAGKHLKKCLASIKKQTYAEWEIIIVDQESTDDTLMIANEYGARVISTSRPLFYSPPSQSRNLGAKSARGDILYHLDADMILEERLFEEIVALYAEKKQLALIVHEQDIAEGFWSQCKAFERRCYWGDDLIESARVVSKELFEDVGGYDESISSGEDMHIHKKYKQIGDIGFCQHVVFHNLGKLDLFSLMRKKYNYGKTASIVSTSHKESGLQVLKDEFACYMRNYRRFFSDPPHGLGSLFLKFCEFGAGGVGFISKKLQ